MKLLIVLVAIGVIGIIGAGTIDESHAQTILTIPEPDNMPDARFGTFSLRSTGITNTWFSVDNDTISHLFGTGRDEIVIGGNVYMKLDTLLKQNQLFSNITSEIACNIDLRTVKTLLGPPKEAVVPNLIVPSNIPDNKTTIHAIGLDFHNNTISGTRATPCTPDLEAPTKIPLLTRDGKEIRFTITDKHDKKAYYFSPRENIMEAQPIPLCTDENIYLNNQTLKGNTKMCYGKNGNDMIIITKRATGFYGATESITTPTKQYALDSDVTDTKEYYELLKKLYLPAI